MSKADWSMQAFCGLWCIWYGAMAMLADVVSLFVTLKGIRPGFGTGFLLVTVGLIARNMAKEKGQ